MFQFRQPLLHPNPKNHIADAFTTNLCLLRVLKQCKQMTGVFVHSLSTSSQCQILLHELCFSRSYLATILSSYLIISLGVSPCTRDLTHASIVLICPTVSLFLCKSHACWLHRSISLRVHMVSKTKQRWSWRMQ